MSLRFHSPAALLAATALAACSVLPRPEPAPEPAEPRRPELKLSVEPVPLPPGGVARPRAHWVPAGWGELPGWGVDRLAEALDRKSTRLNSSHSQQSRMPSSA